MATMLKYADIPTPALLVDLNAMEQNLRTMARFFEGRAAKLRPHFKNHRVLELAALQIEHGAIGITCARLWQAERLVNYGIRNILIANEIAGEMQLHHFVELSKEAPIIIGVDSEHVVADLSRLARKHKVSLNVVVDIDLGLKRCGVSPGSAAVSLATSCVKQGLQFRGIMGYEGHLQLLLPGSAKRTVVNKAMKSLIDTKKMIERLGIPVEIVSCGGSGDYATSGAYPGVTENQAGAYLLMDTLYAPFASDFTATLSLLTTIISKTRGERIVLDGGVKSISGERGLPSVKDKDGLILKTLNAEHAIVEITRADIDVEVGDKVELSIHYHDATIHLHNRIYAMRNGIVERIFIIEHQN
jgi:D-serine deaminase-like pyridoxal phosphate-dependent protein